MQFKVGDRVEAIKPPNGVEESQADQIGWGKLLSINPAGEYGETHEVQLDTGEEWWYSEDRLRPIVSKPTPTPSITVGTQVRLTGVVTSPPSERDGAVAVRIGGAADTTDTIFVVPSDLEVIRQPFKRGEVVWGTEIVDPDLRDIPFDVLDDEANGRCFMVQHHIGAATFNADVTFFERRP